MIAFDAAHAAVHYRPDRRFRIWIRPSVLVILAALIALPSAGTWIDMTIFGLPYIAPLPQVYPNDFSGPHGFPLWVRNCHFFNFLFVTMLIRSGLSILFDHPRLYFNDNCTPGSEWIRLTPIHVPRDRIWTAKDDARYITPVVATPGYPVALLMMLVSMLCWGSWANTEKIDKTWRFELYYWDYMWGLVACALLFGLTLGRTNPAAPVSFFHNLSTASTRSLAEAFAGGIIFNLGNLLLVAAISVAGMAVAFPLGAGLALVIGAVLNYFISPVGNRLLLFGGILLICGAIASNAMAYRRLSKNAEAGTKGIVLSLLCGVVIGLFYPFVAKALNGENHLGPYTVYFVFALGALASNLPLNYAFMRRPVSGSRLSIADYFKGGRAVHVWGVIGGLIWGTGTICSFVAAYVPMVGPATSFSLSEGNTMVSAIWGVFVWKEFRGANNQVKRLLAVMFTLFVLGLVSISLAPVFR